VRAGVPCAVTARKRDDQIGLALVQHPEVTNESRSASFVFPVCWKLKQFDSTCTRPFASDPINPAGITLDDGSKAVLAMKPVQFREDELGIVKRSPATN
jgi:hypothetical protein